MELDLAVVFVRSVYRTFVLLLGFSATDMGVYLCVFLVKKLVKE